MLGERTPELRSDVLTGRLSIIAAGRSLRPNAISPDPPLVRIDDPFAEGSEAETPGELFALRHAGTKANEPGWRIRVVPNRFPAVISSGSDRAGHGTDLFPVVEAFGLHSVVIECPDARSRFAQLTIPEVTDVLTAWQFRVRQLRDVRGITHVAIFRNEGFSAGASLAHCHSQIIATHTLAPALVEREAIAWNHRKQTGRDLVQDWLEAELSARQRVIRETSSFVTVCPFASCAAWHVRIVPQASVTSEFADVSSVILRELAFELLTIVHAIETVIGPFSFNLTLPMSRIDRPAVYRWMIDVIPRTSRGAGWEVLTDIEIVTTPPEAASEQIRGAIRTIARTEPTNCSDAGPSKFRWVDPENRGL